MSRIGAALASLPFTLADVCVLGGFGAMLYGSWITFGPGPTFIMGGFAVLALGVTLYRAGAGNG